MRARFFSPAIMILAACMVLLPATARLEEKSAAPSPSSSEAPADAPASQGELIMPAGQGESPAVEKLITAEPEKKQVKTPATRDGKYTIKQGDTLWDISNGFYRDPFLWPLIWKANPYVANPDLIYPGNMLVIPSLAPIERAIQKPAEKPAPREPLRPAEEEVASLPGPAIRPKPAPTAPEEEAVPAAPRIILPEEAAAPLIDKYTMLSAGFISQDETDDIIVGSLEPKSIYAYDDIVYIRITSRETVNVGDKFLIYSVQHKVKHPRTGDNYGRLIKGLGVLQVTAKDTPEVLTARITLSFDAIEKGSFITPYQEPSLMYETPVQRNKDIAGYILEVLDGRTINAQMDVVYVDKGSSDGIEPGDRLLVYMEPDESDMPKKFIGEVQVFLVKENSSTAVVRKSVDTLAKGDILEYKK